MKHHADILFGAAGSTATLTLGSLNFWLGFASGVLTISVMALRLRREWRNRNKPPTDL